jgi:putative methionine-R-sulfoxide reductase with GAF domain
LRVNKTKKFKYSSGFALTNSDNILEFKEGENITGQAAASKDIVIIDNIPEEYFTAESGLGNAKPKQIIIVPVLIKNNVDAVLELSSFKSQSNINKEIIRNLMTEVGSKIEQITKA